MSRAIIFANAATLVANTLLVIGAIVLAIIAAVIVFKNISFGIPTLGQKSEATSLNTGTNGSGTNLSGGCSNLNQTLDNGATVISIINQASRDSGLAASKIAAIMEIESSFNPKATSMVDGNPIAYGLMQTIPPTYNQAVGGKGKKVEYTHVVIGSGDNAFDSYVVRGENYILNDPYAATYAGSNYLKDLIKQFGEDKGVMAYNWGPGNIASNYKIPTSVKDYLQKYKTALSKYTSCENEAKSGETAQILIDYVNKAPKQTTCQLNNGTGSSGCYQTVEKVLKAAFPGSNARGDGSWIRDYSSDQDIINRPPSGQDISDAVSILKRETKEPSGNLPVWHIRGNGSGQHWIVVVGIEGANIKFFDPEYGEIRTQPADFKSSKGWYYFAVTAKGAGDNSNYKRGYEFSPKR
ncbi:transglycosylase SLT domain-containing protein [Candidatus Berkelbacteria bacterium]|nr:transglycosylase SLT domain-containing protein [Candidatus Berkelbacteria bacterium]